MAYSPGNARLYKKFGNAIKPKFKLLETIFATVAIVGLLLKMGDVTGYTFPLVMSLSGLAIIYYLMMFADVTDVSNFWDMVMIRVAFGGCAVGSIGILFSIQSYPGVPMMYVGTTTLFAAVFYFIVKMQTDFVKNNKKMALRTTVLLICAAILLSVPRETLVQWHVKRPIKIMNTTNNRY